MAGRPEQQKRTASSYQSLLDVATQRLITHALDALAGLVTPSILARSSRAVSVDTAYRLLESPEHTIQVLTNRVIPPDFASEELNWPAFSEVNLDTINSLGGESSIDGIHTALCNLIINNFSLPSSAIGRMIDAATITASEAWHGELRIRDERLAIARQIRTERLRAVRAIDEELSWLVRIALVQLRRRPRSSLTFEKMVILLRALADGGIDRMFLDPESVTVTEIATAMIDLGFAMTEDGLMPEMVSRFGKVADIDLDMIILTAERLWRSGPPDEVRSELIAQLGLPTGRFDELFPDDVALADAVVGCLVIGVPIDGSRESRLVLLSAALHRLAQMAADAPALIALAMSSDRSDCAAEELRAAARSLASERSDGSIEADRVAAQLIATASRGPDHWETTRLLLDLLRG